MSKSSEIYQPLSQLDIRILHLKPSSERTAPLIGHLSTISTTNNIPYTALSYVWGTITTPSPESLNLLLSNTETESNTNTPIKITASLDRALRRTRSKSHVLALWIDQLCINQSDAVEKAHQISMMDRIFARAEEVIVHLCNCAAGDDDTPDKGKEVDGRPTILDIMEWHAHTSLDAHLPRPLINIAEYKGLNCVVGAPWWTRIWTVQEAVFAKKLTFYEHHRSVSGLALERFCEWWKLHRTTCCRPRSDFVGMLNTEVMEPVSRVVDLLALRRKYSNEGVVPGLLEMLVKTQHRDASELHDRIYGLASLTKMPAPLIDYSISPQECYIRTAKYIIESSGRLDVFRQLDCSVLMSFNKKKDGEGEDPPKALTGLPSWVPNWTIIRNGFFQNHLQRYHRVLDYYKAAADTIAQPVLYNHTHLALRGVRCTTITKVSQCWDGLDLQPSSAAQLEIWANLKCLESFSFNSGVSEANFFHVTSSIDPSFRYMLQRHKHILQSTMISRGDKRVSLFYEIMYRDMARENPVFDFAPWVLPSLATPEGDAIDEVESLGFEVYTELEVIRRRLAATTDGRYGIVPDDTQPGDHVVVLYGGNTPFVIRKAKKRSGRRKKSAIGHQSTPRNRYRVIGETYIHGLMCGEVIEDVKTSKRVEEDFLLI